MRQSVYCVVWVFVGKIYIPMKYLIAVLLVLPALLMSLLPAGESAETTGEATVELPAGTAAEAPVVLELFTSQGCSSCPPADALLRELEAGNDGVIALSFHVDYWNYLGWKDPFSSPYFSARQSDYTDALRARTYTPQLVINGRSELIGSRKAEVRQAVADAQQDGLTISPSFSSVVRGREVIVNYLLENPPAGHRVTALLVQPEATSAVSRGENRGRELHHINVVRAMAHGPAAVKGTFTLPVPEGLDAEGMEVVLLVQEKKSQVIVGAARG